MTAPTPQSDSARRLSFYALVAAAIVVGWLFFRVIEPFLLPLLLAAVLAILFRPFHELITRWLRGHRRLAAAAVTMMVLMIGLLPLSGTLIVAGQELVAAGQDLLQSDWRHQPVVADVVSFVERHFPEKHWDEWRQSAVTAVEGMTNGIYGRTTAVLENIVDVVVGLAILVLGLFYFLAEGPLLLRAVQRISPLRNEDEEALFEQFGRVCRAVVLASLVCALVQSVLAGIGFAVLGIERVWLLAGIVMFASLIPVLGSAAVWGSVVVWLVVQGRYGTAIGLVVYGTAIVSTSDHLIRAYVIHGTAKLHPLVALISVLGALQVVGLWGVFVGPIIAAFFYALLKILHDRLEQPDGPGERHATEL